MIPWTSLIALLLSSQVFAARRAVVSADYARLRETADASSRVLEVVDKGESVLVSNQPKVGFYKAKIASGLIGWISASDIRLEGGSSGNSAIDDEPIGSGVISFDLNSAWSDDLGLSGGASTYFRLNKGEGNTLELGIQGLFYLFNVASPVEVDSSIRYWLGRKGLEAGFEFFIGYTFFASSDFSSFARSLSFGPGIFASTRLSKGTRLFIGLREDFHAEHDRYLLAGIGFYL